MRKYLSSTAEFILHRFGESGLLLFMALVIGLAGGIFATVLKTAVHTTFKHIFPYFDKPWGFLIPGIGALLSVLFLRYLIKDKAGHGIPDVIHSITAKGGKMRVWDAISRMISSFLTVSAGGSAGLEGPIAFTGSGLGSNISTYFKLNDKLRTILIGAGASAGIGAMFNAPLAGMVFSLEILLEEWSSRTIIPTAIATIVSTKISRILMGDEVTFQAAFSGMQARDLVACFVLGICTGLVAVAFSRGMEKSEKLFKRSISNPLLRALLGGSLVGLMFMLSPKSLGEGYGVIQQMISGRLEFGIIFVLTLLGVKILVSIITLSSGGSGGIFAPSLFIGAATGLAFGRILHYWLPGLHFSSPEAFALVGMSGMIAGILQAPLTGMFLVQEITSGYDLILPLMLVSVVSMITNNIFEDGSIYTKHLKKNKKMSRTGSDGRILFELNLDEILETDCAIVPDNMLLKDFIEVFKQSNRNQYIVINGKTEKFAGVIYFQEIKEFLFETAMYGVVTTADMMKTDMEIVIYGEKLNLTIEKFEKSAAYTLPVIDPVSGKYLGLISKANLFTRYRQELIVQTTI